MTIQDRATDATNRVMYVIKAKDRDLTISQIKELEDEWWDYFYDLLNDDID